MKDGLMQEEPQVKAEVVSAWAVLIQEPGKPVIEPQVPEAFPRWHGTQRVVLPLDFVGMEDLRIPDTDLCELDLVTTVVYDLPFESIYTQTNGGRNLRRSLETGRYEIREPERVLVGLEDLGEESISEIVSRFAATKCRDSIDRSSVFCFMLNHSYAATTAIGDFKTCALCVPYQGS